MNNVTQAPPPVMMPIGRFGRAVAERLTARIPGSTTIVDTTDLRASGSRPVIIASWREARVLSRRVDANPDLSWWLPVVYEHPLVRVGPILRRGLPGCYGCLSTRVLSLRESEYVDGLWDEYDRDPDIGPGGYLEHHAMLAAALAQAVMAAPPERLRSLYTYDVLTADIASHTFVPLSSCARWATAGQFTPTPDPTGHLTGDRS